MVTTRESSFLTVHICARTACLLDFDVSGLEDDYVDERLTFQGTSKDRFWLGWNGGTRFISDNFLKRFRNLLVMDEAEYFSNPKYVTNFWCL